MTDSSPFSKLVPGFDFLQGLVKNAGAALPGIGQWVAPTIDPAELEKRIEELRTVQFWLEQNARLLGATIQALEVQRMTLSTLKTMNVQMDGLRESLQIRMPAMPGAAPSPKTAREAEPEPEAPPAAAASAEPAAAPAPGVVDPLQWWGALTKQFTELATTAMKDTASDAARQMEAAALKTSFDAAKPKPAAKKRPALKAVAARKRAAHR
jgi:hypothetical protein